MEVGVDFAPFGVAAREFNDGFAAMGREALLDEREDFLWSWIVARDVNTAPIAEGFQERDLAGGVQEGEFLHGFGEFDFKWVVEFHSVPFRVAKIRRKGTRQGSSHTALQKFAVRIRVPVCGKRIVIA